MIPLGKDHRVFAFDGVARPALNVPAGTRLRLETADCHDDQLRSPDDVLEAVEWDRINPATGPVYVQVSQIVDPLRAACFGLPKAVIAGVGGELL